MYQISDEELFGMIPRRGQPYTIGNATKIHTSFSHAYLSKLKNIFPKEVDTTIFYVPGWDGRDVVDSKHESALSLKLKGIYRLAFPTVDQAIEDHLEKTNGYIEAFPPIETDWYSKYDSCKFNYFYNAPEDYRPPMEKKLNLAYHESHQDWAEKMPRLLFMALLSTLAFALVLIGGGIYSMIPALDIWVSASSLNFNIHMGIIVVFLEIVGWITFLPQFFDEVENHLLVSVVMMTLIAVLGWFYFPLTAAPSSGKWIEGLIVGLAIWPVRIYFGAVFFIQVGLAIECVSRLLSYRKNLSRYQDSFIRVFEADYNKLHRYLRLRQLWCANESYAECKWLKELSRRLYDYRVEYEICKNARR